MRKIDFPRWRMLFTIAGLLFCLCMKNVNAQTVSTLKGIVQNEKGEAIVGATIQLTNTASKKSINTLSGENGLFQFSNLKAGSTYDVSVTYVGFENYTVSALKIEEGNQNSLLIHLKETASNLNEVVVVGYGTRKKSDITGSVASVKADDIKGQIVTSFDQSLSGKLPGVQVSQPTGAPGGGVTIKVRGAASLSAGTSPLVVIDGMPFSQDISNNSLPNPSTYQQFQNPLSTIDMNDIETIDVLKDAASAAIYGSRGSNGVIIITTKKGKQGRPKINYSFNGGVQEVSKHIDVMNAYDYAKLAYDSHNNAYLDAFPTGSINDPNSFRQTNPATKNNPSTWVPPQVLPYLAGQKGLTNTDWQKAVFRSAPFQNHTISVSGGGENNTYYLSGNYLDQDGIIIHNGFKRYSFRGRLEGQRGKLRYGINVTPSYTINNVVSSEGPWSTNIGNPYGFPSGLGAGVVASALTYAPIFPVYNPDGTFADSVNQWGYGQTNQLNPVALATLVKDQVRNFRFTGTTFVERELITGLRYKLLFGIDANTFIEDFYRPTTMPIQSGVLPSTAYGLSKTDQYINWVLENTLTYDKQIGAGKLNALVGYSAQKENQYHSFASAYGFPNDLVTTVNAGQPLQAYSALEQWTLSSLIARLQYDYKSRYFITGTIRRDGSSRFGTNNKWGSFPSVSAGWIISKEDFFKGLSETISNLKLRASYGTTGNFSIPNYASLALLSTGGKSNYILGNQQVVNGLSVSTPANPNLTWENTASFDAGLDISFLKNALTLTVDYYNSKTSKLLFAAPVPATFAGVSTYLQNIGKVQNTGLEASLTYSKAINKDWAIDVNGNIAFNRNKVLQLGQNNAPIIVSGGTGTAYFITQVGQPIGSYYLLVQDGIYKDQNDLNNSPHFSNSHVGDFKFKDVDGNGTLDALKDRTVVGNFQPKYIFGFNAGAHYKNFDLSFVIQGSQGGKVLDLFRRYLANSEGNFNNLSIMNQRYKSPTDIGNGNINRANRIATGNNGTISTWHIEDGSFVRVKNISLGYNFNPALFKKAGIASIRVYGTIQNAFTFTKYTLFNPEVSGNSPGVSTALAPGQDYGSYPLARSFAFGLNVSF